MSGSVARQSLQAHDGAPQLGTHVRHRNGRGARGLVVAVGAEPGGRGESPRVVLAVPLHLDEQAVDPREVGRERGERIEPRAQYAVLVSVDQVREGAVPPHEDLAGIVEVDAGPLARRKSSRARELVGARHRQDRPIDAGDERVPALLRARGLHDVAEVLRRVRLQPAVLEHARLRVAVPDHPAADVVAVEDRSAEADPRGEGGRAARNDLGRRQRLRADAELAHERRRLEARRQEAEEHGAEREERGAADGGSEAARDDGCGRADEQRGEAQSSAAARTVKSPVASNSQARGTGAASKRPSVAKR